MNYTENLTLGLPEYGEDADVADLNRNSGILDAYCYNTRQIECEPYDSTKTYMSGDLSIHNEVVYECNTDNTTGTWDDSKWDSTTLAEQIAKAKQSGGESALADLEDVNLTNPSEGQILTYDDTNDEWVNTDMPDTAVTKEASGNPIELTDAASAPIVKCVTAITGSQDLHGYDKPWVGGAGKNKFDTDSVYSDTSKYTISNGEVTATAYNFTLAKFNIPSSMVGSPVTFSALLTVPSETSELFVMATVNGVNNKGTSVIASSQGLSSVTFTPTSTNDVIFINYASGGSGVCKASQLQLEVGSTATTFAPYSNICPITAYTEGEIEVGGDNLFDGTYSVNNSYLKADGTTTAHSDYSITNPISVNGGDTVKIAFDSLTTANTPAVCWYDASDNYIGGQNYANDNPIIFTVPSNAKYIKVSVNRTNWATTLTIRIIKQHTTTYPSAIYRGSEDVVNGTETHDTEVYKFTGNETIEQASTNPYVFNVVAPDKFDLGQSGSQDIARPWSHFNGVNYISATDMTDGEARQYRGNRGWIFSFCNHNLSSVSDCATWLANQAQNGTPVQIAAPLATPTTSSVTPTNLPIRSLSGYNHIESSTGDMEVEYITEEYQPLVDLIQSGNGHTYSTQEQVVGKWIDGSDVYEKSFKADNISDDSNHVLDAALTQSAITLLPGTEIIISCTGTYNTDFINTVSDNTFGRVIANVNGLNASIVGYNSLSSQLGTCTLYVTARYLKKSVTRSLSAPVTSQKAQIEPLSDKTEEVPTEEEKAVNEEENNDETR